MTRPAQAPVFVSLERLKCHEQEDSELPLVDVEDDEPYVLVLSIDASAGSAGTGIAGQAPSAELFRIGPVEGVDKGDLKPAPPNTLWGLTGAAAPMPDPRRAILLVALLEHDGADPAKVARSTAAMVRAAVVGLWANAQARRDVTEAERLDLFISSARDSFAEAVDNFRRIRSVPAALLDHDDLIGPVQLLRFDEAELRQVLRREQPTVERTLRFEGDDARYDLTFALRPAVNTLRDLLERTTGRRGGSLAAAAGTAGLGRPVSVRDWARSVR
jgi:hypothetical protein